MKTAPPWAVLTPADAMTGAELARAHALRTAGEAGIEVPARLVRLGDQILTPAGWQSADIVDFDSLGPADCAVRVFTPDQAEEHTCGWQFSPDDKVRIRQHPAAGWATADDGDHYLGVAQVLAGVAVDLAALAGTGLHPTEFVGVTICPAGAFESTRRAGVDAIAAAVLAEPAAVRKAEDGGLVYEAVSTVTSRDQGDVAVLVEVSTPLTDVRHLQDEIERLQAELKAATSGGEVVDR